MFCAKPYMLSLLLITTLGFAADSLDPKPRVYNSFQGEQKFAITLYPLNNDKPQRVLIHFNIPKHPYNNKSYIYESYCKTPRCQQLLYRRKGDTAIHFTAEKKDKKLKLYAYLPQLRTGEPLFYNSKKSRKASPQVLLKNYMVQTEQSHSLASSEALVDEAFIPFTKSCQIKAKLIKNTFAFKRAKHKELLGLAKPIFDSLTQQCHEKKYRDLFKSVRHIILKFSPHFKEMSFTNTDELIIYLSKDYDNPLLTTHRTLDRVLKQQR